MDQAGDRASSVGVQEMAILPVHLPQRPAVGQRNIPQGGKCYQCRAEEEGKTLFVWFHFILLDFPFRYRIVLDCK